MSPLKILSTNNIKIVDKYTIINEPISSINLMERAANKCFEWIKKHVDTTQTIKIFCGKGNNGGDGLAIARLLFQAGYDIEVFIVHFSNDSSPDFAINFKRLADLSGVVIIDLFENDFSFQLNENDIIIDSIFGIGLNSSIKNFVAQIINTINQSKAIIVSIDFPSGIFADKLIENNGVAVKADYTLTFQTPKLAMLIPEYDEYVGKWEILNIGLDNDFINTIPENNFYTLLSDCKSIYNKRSRFSNKRDYGHAMLISGSKSMIGAAILSARACLKSGAGLLTVHLPESGYNLMQLSLPEAIVSCDNNSSFISNLPEINNYSAIGIGPGIGKSALTKNVIAELIKTIKKPLVIDADAINIIAENKYLLEFIPKNTILTPHNKEFERLVGQTDNSFNKIELLRVFAEKYKIIVVLKGANSAIATPEGEIYFNSTGNSGMATAGSGDVLTGIILAQLAKGLTPLNAAILSVWIHGKAGDIACEKSGYESLIASNIIDNIGKAFKIIEI